MSKWVARLNICSKIPNSKCSAAFLFLGVFPFLSLYRTMCKMGKEHSRWLSLVLPRQGKMTHWILYLCHQPRPEEIEQQLKTCVC